MGGSTLIAVAHTRNLSVVMARPIPWYGFFGPTEIDQRQGIHHEVAQPSTLVVSRCSRWRHFAVRPRSHDY
jgi:hypothetical protein